MTARVSVREARWSRGRCAAPMRAASGARTRRGARRRWQGAARRGRGAGPWRRGSPRSCPARPARESKTTAARAPHPPGHGRAAQRGGASSPRRCSSRSPRRCPPATAKAQDVAVCDRTTQVRDAIVAEVAGVTDCADVTAADLADITDLEIIEDSSLTSLQAGDFGGLTGLTTAGPGRQRSDLAAREHLRRDGAHSRR